MNFLGPTQTQRGARSRAFTLVEVIMAMGIGVLVLGALSKMVLLMGMELKGGMSSASLQQEAGLVQDKLINLLRPMSVTEGVAFTDPVPGKPTLFRTLILARGAAPAFPRESISFSVTNLTLTYDPNRASANNEVILSKPGKVVTLRDLYFFPAYKAGGRLDDSTLNVVMAFDDATYATPRTPTGGLFKTNSVYRYFTVRMRSG